jgi:hypothetical protein
MKIALYNLEPYYTNIALEKIRLYHKGRGDTVTELDQRYREKYDKVYCSSIFRWSPKELVHQNDITGGSGFDITSKLPPEIDCMRPKLNIGFTSRGCIRSCPYCIVHKKEGRFKITGDIHDFWDGKSEKITILDNNILADKDHFVKICQQLQKNKIIIDFNQGLDCRLIDDDVARWLKTIRHTYYYLAFDDINIEPAVLKAIRTLKKHGIRHSTWYVLVGFNTTLEEDLYRCNLLKKTGQRVYICRYNNDKSNTLLMALSGWANYHKFFSSMTFKQYLSRPDRRYHLRNLFKKGVVKLATPTPEMKERARKAKGSLMANLETMDVYSKFKVLCSAQGIKIREGLREAVKDYLDKYTK